MARGRRKRDKMKGHAAKISNLEPHPENQVDRILRRQGQSGNCEQNHSQQNGNTTYPEKKVRSECGLINQAGVISEDLIYSHLEQCSFEKGMGDFTETLQGLELKECHLRTILGDRFDEKSFDAYRQNTINNSIRIMQARTSNHVNEIFSIDTSNQKEEIHEDIWSQIESTGRYRKEMLDEVKARLVKALMTLKKRERKMLLSFGDLGRMDYAKEFMGQVIEAEQQRLGIEEETLSLIHI